MITIDEVVTVCDAYLSARPGPECHGFARNVGALPIYRPNEARLPICTEASLDRSIGETCRHFYRNLPLGAGHSECPFGVHVLYQRLTISGKPLCLYVQGGFTARAESAADFPRITKKAVGQALGRPTKRLDLPHAKNKFEQARELLSTLLTGRVAESIRALSHHLLTPLQGAIADVERLADDPNVRGEIPTRLGRNLADVDSSAKQIQILLSDEAEFSPQKLRRVSVASMVASLIKAIEAEAHRRNVRIEHSTNYHTRDVQAIPDQLSLVLSALLQNAVKYSFEGSVERFRLVKVTYASEGENLIIRFQNEGCGMDSDEIVDGKIFELG